MQNMIPEPKKYILYYFYQCRKCEFRFKSQVSVCDKNDLRVDLFNLIHGKSNNLNMMLHDCNNCKNNYKEQMCVTGIEKYPDMIHGIADLIGIEFVEKEE